MAVMKPPASFSDKSDFAKALRLARQSIGVTQEAFDQVSSRTYVSSLERGLKQPTLSKVDELASVLGIHPLSLIALAYLTEPTSTSAQQLMAQVRKDMLILTGETQ